jgi:hypothetical protein
MIAKMAATVDCLCFVVSKEEEGGFTAAAPVPNTQTTLRTGRGFFGEEKCSTLKEYSHPFLDICNFMQRSTKELTCLTCLAFQLL